MSLSAISSSVGQDVRQGGVITSAQSRKVIAVALACLVCFSVQWGMSWGRAVAISLGCAGSTLLSEVTLRNGASPLNGDWFNGSDVEGRELFKCLIVWAAVVILVTVVLRRRNGEMDPAQAVAREILRGDIRTIGMATLIAPVTEEILFRGFMRERLEDILLLMNRCLPIASDGVCEKISLVAQALVFGAIHVVGNQVIRVGRKIPVFCMTALMGFRLGLCSEMFSGRRSLLPSIAVHSAHNTSLTIGLLISRT